ncbi:glycosyltransferase [Cognatilysobacter bugurensis]|uniref:Glycosyl transferase n=1 Tax=Cognatilysobacter bugurensis TaxID=543356 RepID=A0A918SWK3_9GAMM|nr:glycosyltransferase [Lysobacter bugurensis]GHA74909.1 glycosyl transferase [Lysobacter bugurensis]
MSKETDELSALESGSAALAADLDSTFTGGAPAVRAPNAGPSSSARRDDFPIIVHCHLRWDFVWQRPQQIFSRLAKHHRVLFIEDPVIAEGEPHLAVDEPMPNLVRIVPQIPQHLAVNSDKDAEIFFPLIQQALREHPLLAGQFEDAVHWFYSPMSAPGYLGKFGGPGIVYDCMDELANFRFAPPDIGDRERFVMSKADVVFTGGFQLFESKSKHHDNVHFYGCGVDVEHYGKARLEETEVPASVSSLAKPVFGYFGVIDERLDYELVDALAKRFPEASVVMAGPLAKVDRNELPDRPNIHWLGQQKYDDLPSLVKGFDVCLMPFALNDATKYINPTKTLEYMAGGKPVVSTAIADVVRNFTPIVQVAHSPEEFVDAVERAWRSPDQDLIAEGIARANDATWDATIASMRNDIQEAVFGPVSAASDSN